MIDFDNDEYVVEELICVKCLARFINVRPEALWLKDCVCKCGEAGFLIRTGQELPEELIIEYKNG